MDSPGRLVCRFDDHGDGTGRLLIHASSNGFAGEGAAWFSVSQIEDFADAIATYPIPENDAPSIASGFFKKDGSGDLEQEHLALTVSPIDSRGHLSIQVRIATALHAQGRPESQHTVKLEILTSYEPLMDLSRDLKALAHGKLEEISLDGEHVR